MLKTSPAWLVVCLMLCYIYLNTPSSNLKQNLSMMTWLQSSIREGEFCKPEVKPAVTVQIRSDSSTSSVTSYDIKSVSIKMETKLLLSLFKWYTWISGLNSMDPIPENCPSYWDYIGQSDPFNLISSKLWRDLITEMNQKEREESGLSHGWLLFVPLSIVQVCSLTFQTASFAGIRWRGVVETGLTLLVIRAEPDYNYHMFVNTD